MDGSRTAREGRKTKWKARRLTFALVCLAAMSGVLGAGASSADASVEYENVCAGLAPPAICSAGGIPGARGVAVNDVSGDVYVGLVGEIKHFSAAGAALPAITGIGGEADWLAVDNSNEATKGDIYATFFNTTVERFTSAGALDTSWGTNGVLTTGGGQSGGVAVDPANGFLYVVSREASKVFVYNTSGTPAGEFSVNAGTIDGLSVDSGGNAFVVYEGSSIAEYPVSNRAAPVEIGAGLSLTETAVDTSPTGNLFVLGGGTISTFEKTGAHGSVATTFAPGAPGLSYGMAVNATTHAVYVSDISNGDAVYFKLAEHGPPPQPPVTEAAVVAGTSATLHGTVNPTTKATVSYYFDYNATVGESCTGVGHEKSETKTIVEEEAVPVEATVTGLTAKTEYKFCLVAENSGGTIPSLNEEAFTTGVGAPVVREELSSAITPYTATVSAKINPSGEATTCEVEYGETVAYGSKAPCPALAEPEAITDQSVSVPLSGLAASKEYHYHFVAKNSIETVNGSDATFTTEPLAVVTTEIATEVQSRSAELNGSITPNVGGPAEYFFKYGKVGEPLTEETSKVAFTTNPASTLAASLTPDTPYHYQLVAIVEGTEVPASNEQEFTTPPLAEVQNEAASEVGPVSAKLNGHIANGIEASHYYFAYGKEGEPLSNKTPEIAIAAGKTESASAVVSGLAPNTHYEAQLVAVVTGNVLIPATPPVKFTTKVAAPIVINKPPLSVTRTTASLSGEIDTKESATEYFVEYGETTAYGRTEPTAPLSLAAAVGPTEIAPIALPELHAGKVYHYRIVAKNETATTDGLDATFKTAAAQPPVLESESSVQVTQTTATILAAVNPNGLQTSYALEVGTEVEENGVRRIAYTPTFGEVGEGAETRTLPLSGLLPGTTYHYRIVLTNEDGKAGEETDQTFTTSGFPAVITPPALVMLVPFTPPKVEKPGPAHETRAQKYTKAVELCQTIKSKKKRVACMKTARKKYGPVNKKKTKKKK